MTVHLRRRGLWYHADFFRRGFRVRRTLKTTNRRVAQEMASNLERSILGGVWNLPVALETGIRQGIGRYQEEYESLHHAESTRLHIQHTFSLFLSFMEKTLGPKAILDTVRLEDIEAFQRHLLKRITIRGRSMSPPAVNRATRELSGFFTWCVDHGCCRLNPCTTLTSVPEVKKIVSPASVVELRKLIRFLPDVLSDAVRVVVASGLRLGECLHLMASHADLREKLLYVRASPDYLIKDRQERDVPLTAPAIEALRRRLKAVGNRGLLFPSEAGTLMGNRNALRALHLACERGGLRRMTWQLLRKTFATMQGKTLKPWELKAVMGHSDIRTTDRNYLLNTAREARLKAVAF